MHLGQIRHMDVVAHAGAVGGVIVIAEELHRFAQACGGFQRVGGQVGSGSCSSPISPSGLAARSVKIAQGGVLELAHTRAILQHQLDHMLGLAIDIVQLARLTI